MNAGEKPLNLKRAIIITMLIYKEGSMNVPKNYRPVSLTSHLIKILENIFAKIIYQFLETVQKINRIQYSSDLTYPSFSSYWSATTRYWRNRKNQAMLLSSSYILLKQLIKSTTEYYLKNSQNSELVVRSVCDTQFSMKQTTIC